MKVKVYCFHADEMEIAHGTAHDGIKVELAGIVAYVRLCDLEAAVEQARADYVARCCCMGCGAEGYYGGELCMYCAQFAESATA